MAVSNGALVTTDQSSALKAAFVVMESSTGSRLGSDCPGQIAVARSPGRPDERSVSPRYGLMGDEAFKISRPHEGARDERLQSY
jgi:hypothetical protein